MKFTEEKILFYWIDLTRTILWTGGVDFSTLNNEISFLLIRKCDVDPYIKVTGCEYFYV